jgi:hypothetical protein
LEDTMKATKRAARLAETIKAKAFDDYRAIREAEPTLDHPEARAHVFSEAARANAIVWASESRKGNQGAQADGR